MLESGILNVNKPAGKSSFDIVRMIRDRLRVKRVGHGGTLDPMARGVLLVCFGKATKAFDLLIAQKKTYRATVLLGFETATFDLTSEVSVFPEPGIRPSLEDVRKGLSSFLGEIEQLPPVYSAVKVNGRRLYHYARHNDAVEVKPRKVTVYSIELLDYSYPYIKFTVECSKGTYIRTIARYLGALLGTRATMNNLVRTRSGRFGIEDSLDMDAIERMTAGELLEHACLLEDAVNSGI